MLFIRHLNECNECVDYNSQWLMLLFVNIDTKYSVSLREYHHSDMIDSKDYFLLIFPDICTGVYTCCGIADCLMSKLLSARLQYCIDHDH